MTSEITAFIVVRHEIGKNNVQHYRFVVTAENVPAIKMKAQSIVDDIKEHLPGTTDCSWVWQNMLSGPLDNR